MHCSSAHAVLSKVKLRRRACCPKTIRPYASYASQSGCLYRRGGGSRYALSGPQDRGWAVGGPQDRGWMVGGPQDRGWVVKGPRDGGWIVGGPQDRGWMIRGPQDRGWMVVGL